jgi:hypothetical protein
MSGLTKAEKGRIKRQKILDYLNRVGVLTNATELMAVTKEANRPTMVARLQRMHETGEVARETLLVNGNYTHYYTAVVKTTTSTLPPHRWASAAKAAKAGRVEDDDEEPVDVPQGPWHTIHRCSRKRPSTLGRQGGQSSSTGFQCASVITLL